MERTSRRIDRDLSDENFVLLRRLKRNHFKENRRRVDRVHDCFVTSAPTMVLSIILREDEQEKLCQKRKGRERDRINRIQVHVFPVYYLYMHIAHTNTHIATALKILVSVFVIVSYTLGND